MLALKIVVALANLLVLAFMLPQAAAQASAARPHAIKADIAGRSIKHEPAADDRVVPASTWAQGFRYTPDSQQIRLQLVGGRPTWSLHSNPDEKTAYVDIGSSHGAYFDLVPEAEAPGESLIKRILLAENHPGVVRLALNSTEPFHVHARLLQRGPTWILVLSARPSPATSRVALPHPGKPGPRRNPHPSSIFYPMDVVLSPVSGTSSVPLGTKGQPKRFAGVSILLRVSQSKPIWHAYRNPGQVVYLDFSGVDGAKAVLDGRTHSLNPRSGLLERILYAQNRPGVVRLALRGRVPIALTARLDGSKAWTVVVHALGRHQVGSSAHHKPSHQQRRPARAVPRSPSPPTTPARPSSSTKASSEAKPVQMPARVSPRAPAPVLPPAHREPPRRPQAQRSFAWPRIDWLSDQELPDQLLGGWNSGNFTENYPDGGVNNLVIAGNPSYSVFLKQRIKDAWGLEIEASRWPGFMIIDSGIVGTHHYRNETSAEVSVDRDFFPWGLRFTPTAGWFYRRALNVSSAAPIVPSYLTSSTMEYTGPQLGIRAEVPVWGPLQIIGDIKMNPLVLAALDPDVPPLEPLLGGQASIGLQLGLGYVLLQAGYGESGLWRYTLGSSQNLTGFQGNSGPVVSAGCRY